MAQIAASIVEFGFTNPILVDSMDGIIAGHGRLLAARKLGLPEVPVVVLDHLSETQRRAYIIADNKLAINAGWDEKILAAELRELEKEGMDLAVVGFSDEELEALLEDGEQPPEDVADEVTEPPAQPVTQPGDVGIGAGIVGGTGDVDRTPEIQPFAHVEDYGALRPSAVKAGGPRRPCS